MTDPFIAEAPDRRGGATRRVLPLAVWTILAAGIVTPGAGAELKSDSDAMLTPKNPTAELKALDINGPTSVGTYFAFHPPHPAFGVISDALSKNFAKKLVDPSEVTRVYTPNELHDTTGEVRHRLAIKTTKVNGKDVPNVHDLVRATIVPGKNDQAPNAVFVQAYLYDPIVFSDTSGDALFEYEPSGLDVAFSLGQGTRFPNKYSLGPGDPGAIAEDTYLRYRFRVAPGVISDPAAFWSEGLPGAIDLYDLTIQSDASFNVTATLLVGSSTDDFLVDSSGTAAAVAAIENAFAGNAGRILSNLQSLFVVGFVPEAGVEQYTVGMFREAGLGALELVPEPGTFLLLVSGAIALPITAWRRRRAASVIRPA